MENKYLLPVEHTAQQHKTSVLDIIPLPGKEDGYARGTLVGASGAGKTSLLRFLAGTAKEKFPATSSSRTTTCNMELIFSPEPDYEIAVSFMPRQRLESLLMENIEAAVRYCLQSTPGRLCLSELAEKLLNHRDQTLRLSYLLGDPDLLKRQDETDEFDEDFFGSQEETEQEEVSSSVDTQQLAEKIGGFLQLTAAIADTLSAQEDSADEDLCLDENELACQLRDDMVKEIGQRFLLLQGGQMLGLQPDWVEGWYYTSTDRKEFIHTAKQFSDNSKKAWGRLLTPLVDSMRVKGSFKPACMDTVPSIVLFDGQGVGHSTMVQSSIPSDVRDYFALSDTIILVDNAEQPILENARLTLKTVIETGKADQLVTAFTHMDRMEGDNFSTIADKAKYVQRPLHTYLQELKRNNPQICSDGELQSIQRSCLYFFELDKSRPASGGSISQKQAEKLIAWMHQHRQASTCAEDVQFEYTRTNLLEALEQAIRQYRRDWTSWQGILACEHWSRIKALSKRLGYCNMDNYNNELEPLADLQQALQSPLNEFVRSPMAVKPIDASAEIQVEQAKAILRDMERAIYSFVYIYMWQREDQLKRWQQAYDYSGRGSTLERKEKIGEIFEIPAPNFTTQHMTAAQRENLGILCRVVENVLKRHNASLLPL